MMFIYKFFHFNVHNKTAGIVYRSVISRFSFNEFKEFIWPFWVQSFKKETGAREFNQSLLKYWIPFSVERYGVEVYEFICTQGVDPEMLIEILYELRRKRFISMELLYEECIFQNILNFLENKRTFARATEVISLFPIIHEKLSPTCLQTIEKYLLTENIYFEKI
ncbi:hypothetical protein HHI36_021631 [Cryptolaemus montrouzieri]|uniref:Uncharacterized protein n=1 Tax=Cryptolaemus montrouzieri TaxID=559131 RepID=A0ABD2MXL0_9CUCU